VNPEHPVLRTGGTLLITGILFAALSALCSTLLIRALDLENVLLRGAEPRLLFPKLVVYAIVLFAILVGFLMWTVSAERVQESRAIAAREAVLRAKAEAKALRAQFNPHFVFNTLHSLMLLVREDPGTAEQAIEDVASLIRYASSLERRGQDVVPLSQEVEIARKYLALESLRLEDRMEVVWEVADELGDVAVPAFALQTLLENAIKHGLSPKPEGGTITIRVRAEGERMSLTVGDDGMGAVASEVVASDGNGLTLLGHRLLGLYGDAASSTWHTEPGRGFTVTLEWPRTRAGEPVNADAT
jgi:LytS/YehU family sensor histidine kinase